MRALREANVAFEEDATMTQLRPLYDKLMAQNMELRRNLPDANLMQQQSTQNVNAEGAVGGQQQSEENTQQQQSDQNVQSIQSQQQSSVQNVQQQQPIQMQQRPEENTQQQPLNQNV